MNFNKLIICVKGISHMIFVMLLLLFTSCSNYHDLLDSVGNSTKLITDKQQLNWDSSYVRKYGNRAVEKRKLTGLDTFIIIKPVIDVNRVYNEKYWCKREMLDDTNLDLWMKNNSYMEKLYELDWISFVHYYLSYNVKYYKQHYLPNITETDFEIIKNQVHIMESFLDSQKVKEYIMPDGLYNVLSKYSGQYYILNSLKERYGKTFDGTLLRNFLRMRVFVFNKMTRKILFYNREIAGFNLDPYFGNRVGASDYRQFVKIILRPFKRDLNGKLYEHFIH